MCKEINESGFQSVPTTAGRPGRWNRAFSPSRLLKIIQLLTRVKVRPSVMMLISLTQYSKSLPAQAAKFRLHFQEIFIMNCPSDGVDHVVEVERFENENRICQVIGVNHQLSMPDHTDGSQMRGLLDSVFKQFPAFGQMEVGDEQVKDMVFQGFQSLFNAFDQFEISSQQFNDIG